MSGARPRPRGRALTLFERACYLDGRTPFALALAVRVRGRVDAECLRRALDGLQARYPMLRCHVEQREGRPWFVPQQPAPALPLQCIERRDGQHWLRSVQRELQRPFTDQAPLLRALWLHQADVGELVLICHHCICDGLALATLLREWLDGYAMPPADVVPDGHLGGIESLLPAAWLRDRGRLRRARWKAALFKAFLASRRPGPALGYGPLYLMRRRLGRDELAALAMHCRAQDVTVFGALATAFMHAFREVRGARGVDGFRIPVDGRRVLGLAPDAWLAMAPTVRLAPWRRRCPVRRFWSRARALRKTLQRRVARLRPRTLGYLLGLEQLHDQFDKLIAFAQSRPCGRQVTLSYLGSLDLPARCDAFDVEAAFGPLATLAPTPATLLTFSRFGGCLDISLAADEQSLPKAQAEAVLAHAMRMLHRCAGLPCVTQAVQDGTDAPVPATT